MADCTMAQLAAGTEMSFMLISLGMHCSSRHDLFYVRHSSVPCCKPRWQLVLYVYVARLICVCVCDCVGAAPQVLPWVQLAVLLVCQGAWIGRVTWIGRAARIAR